MIIGFDASMIDEFKAGIGYYAFSLLKALAQEDGQNQYILYTNDSKKLLVLNLPQNFRIIEVNGAKPGLSWMFKVWRRFKKDKIEVFISPSNLFFGTVFPSTITVIHDLSQLKFPQFFSRKGNIIYKLQLKRLLNKEKLIIVPTQTVKNELIELNKNVENKVLVLGEGPHEWVFLKTNAQEVERVKAKYNLPEKYFLSVSTLEPRKNYVNAIKGFELFSQDEPEFKYLIAGKKGWFYDEILQTVKTNGLYNKVIFLGYVPEEDLPVLYDLSKGCISLSFYEGFGLPLIESYWRGRPVLASDIPVFREVMGNNAVYADPYIIEDIAEGMKKLSDKRITRDRTFTDKYSWNLTAKKLVDLYQKAIG